MPSNVEIKASISNIKQFKEKAKNISQSEGEILIQEDTFFKVPSGRLKLRNIKNSKSELIFYDRPDQDGPKFSNFSTATVSCPDSLKETLGMALGIRGVVKKVRTLYMVEQTRVHVDQVEGLGDFMELEVQMKEGQPIEEGQKIAEGLMAELGVQKSDLISVAYMDLLLNKNGET